MPHRRLYGHLHFFVRPSRQWFGAFGGIRRNTIFQQHQSQIKATSDRML